MSVEVMKPHVGNKVVGLRLTADLRFAAEEILAFSPSFVTEGGPESPTKLDDASVLDSPPALVPLNDATESVPGNGVSISKDSRTFSSSSNELGLARTLQHAKDVLKLALADVEKRNETLSSHPGILPLAALKSMRDILTLCGGDMDGGASELLKTLERAIFTSGGLSFIVEVPDDQRTSEEMKEAEKFQRRMERLRLKAEERKYHNLVDNVDAMVEEDDVTTRSMTYAASVGLNMIVAPLSFGAFVYFFVSKLIFNVHEEDEDAQTTTGRIDLRREMLGVAAGVSMLFIEMILFVIRTYELDTHTRKKKKKNQNSISPFGRKQGKVE